MKNTLPPEVMAADLALRGWVQAGASFYKRLEFDKYVHATPSYSRPTKGQACSMQHWLPPSPIDADSMADLYEKATQWEKDKVSFLW